MDFSFKFYFKQGELRLICFLKKGDGEEEYLIVEKQVFDYIAGLSGLFFKEQLEEGKTEKGDRVFEYVFQDLYGLDSSFVLQLNSKSKLEDVIMSVRAPYKLWSLKPLKLECKKRKMKGWEKETDKSVLVTLLETDDAQIDEPEDDVVAEGEVVNEQLEEEEVLEDEEPEEESEEVEEILVEESEEEAAEDEEALEEEIPDDEVVAKEEVAEKETSDFSEQLDSAQSLGEDVEEEYEVAEEEKAVGGEIFVAEALKTLAEDMGYEIVVLKLTVLDSSDEAAKKPRGRPPKKVVAKHKSGKALTTVSSRDLMKKIREKKLWRQGAQFLTNDEKLQLLRVKNDEEREVIYAIIDKKFKKVRAKQSAAMSRRLESEE